MDDATNLEAVFWWRPPRVCFVLAATCQSAGCGISTYRRLGRCSNRRPWLMTGTHNAIALWRHQSIKLACWRRNVAVGTKLHNVGFRIQRVLACIWQNNLYMYIYLQTLIPTNAKADFIKTSAFDFKYWCDVHVQPCTYINTTHIHIYFFQLRKAHVRVST